MGFSKNKQPPPPNVQKSKPKWETYPLTPKLDHVMEEKWNNDEEEHREEQRNDENSNDNRKGHKMSM